MRFKNIRKVPSKVGLVLTKPPPIKKLRLEIKGELTWKIYLCILLPKYVYLFIQCTKNMFLINEFLCIS